MRIRTDIVIIAVGTAATVAASVLLHMPASGAIRLAGTAGAGALAVGVAGTGLLFLLRNRSVGVQVTVVALASVGAVAVGAIAAGESMFISAHDLDTLAVILLASATVGALVAFLLGRRVSHAGRTVGAMARTIGTGVAPDPDRSLTTAEFTALAGELEEMAARLEQAHARERAIDASRRELIAWVSHDLRTPLAGIRAIAEALEDGVVEDDDTAARYHRTLRIESERLARLVDELFELSVIRAGALRLQMERASLSDLVSDAISAASVAAAARRVKVEGQVNGTAPELDLDPPEVARVLRNLLDNAIRHTPSDGSVWVETGLDGPDAYVSVADECGGIPEPDLPRVFELAFRGEPARTPSQNGGAGLGLAIARGIVHAHHGEITVRNDGPGCRFTMRLPLSQPA
jgi:signal transduction histidine kinase